MHAWKIILLYLTAIPPVQKRSIKQKSDTSGSTTSKRCGAEKRVKRPLQFKLDVIQKYDELYDQLCKDISMTGIKQLVADKQR